MKSNTLIILLTLLTLPSLNVHAEDEPKHFNIGIGGYALNITDDDNSNIDEDFSGAAISLQYAFTDQLAIRGDIYSLEDDDFSAIELKGGTLSLVIGVGLVSEGFKFYVGGGIFSETLEIGPVEEDITGLQATAGIGYNWDIFSIEAGLGVRDPSEYEDALPLDEAIVITLSATFSMRI